MNAKNVSWLARATFVAVLAAGITSCHDSPQLLAPDTTASAVPPGTLRTAIACHGNRRTLTLSCAAPSAAQTGTSNIILGGQDQYVTLWLTNTPSYNAETGHFTFEVAVRNLIGQPIGYGSSLKVFFTEPPVVLAGTGSIEVLGSGVGVFTASDQPYYDYPVTINPGESPLSVTWTLAMPETVTDFSFSVYVDAPVQYPNGWVSLARDRSALDLVASGEQTATLTATVYNVLGAQTGATPTFSSSNAEIATVDGNGIVTAAGVGTATITATAGLAGGSVDFPVTAAPTLLTLSDSSLTADGTSTAVATLTMFDTQGRQITTGGEDVTFGLANLNSNTAGGVLSPVIDHGDGTYTATVSSVNNGSTVVTAYQDGVAVNAAPLGYSGGNNIPTVPPFPSCTLGSGTHDPPICSLFLGYANLPHLTEGAFELNGYPVTLPGEDADSDPLTARITALSSAQGTVLDADAVQLSVGAVTSTGIYFKPQHPDVFGPYLMDIRYVLSDGTAESDEGRVVLIIDGVNDAPGPTLASSITYFEDQTSTFLMGGFDPEGDLFRVRYTLRPDLRGSLYHISPSGDVLITPATTTLEGSSDISFGWPMRFVPDANDWSGTSGDPYMTFSYLLEEIPSGFHGDENTVDIYVLPVNDAPLMTVSGIGSAQNHALSATVVQGGDYTLPTLSISDADMPFTSAAGTTVGFDAEFAVRIESSAGSVLNLDTFDYEDAGVSFTRNDTSIVFTMRNDVTNQGFRPGLTLGNLLSALHVTPNTTGPGVLILTVDDQGNYGWCDENTPSCSLKSVTTISMDVQAGTPPAAGTTMSLTPSGE